MNGKFNRIIEKELDVLYSFKNMFYVFMKNETHMAGLFLAKKNDRFEVELYSEGFYFFNGKPSLLTTVSEFNSSELINDFRSQVDPKDPEEVASRFVSAYKENIREIEIMSTPDWTFSFLESIVGLDLNKYPNIETLALRGFTQVLLDDFEGALDTMKVWSKYLLVHYKIMADDPTKINSHGIDDAKVFLELLNRNPCEAKSFVLGRGLGVKSALGM